MPWCKQIANKRLPVFRKTAAFPPETTNSKAAHVLLSQAGGRLITTSTSEASTPTWREVRSSSHRSKAESRRNDRGTWLELQRMVSRCCIYTLKRTRSLLLQDIRIVYKLARILTKSRKLDHIPPVLISTRWLPVHTGSDFKIRLPAYKILHGSASVTPGAPARAPEIPVWQLLDHSINKQNIGRW